MIITRKIEIYIDAPDKTVKSEQYKKMFEWIRICRQAANLASSHLYVQDNVKEMIYLSEGVKVKLADMNKDESGILVTSYQNSIYRLLSRHYLEKISSEILTTLATIIFKTYKEEKTDVISGNKSLRSYRNNIPLPVKSGTINFVKKQDSANYTFIFNGQPKHKIAFSTILGRDRSGNKVVIEKILSGEYKICTSSIFYNKAKNKFFLLACVDIPQTPLQLTENKLFAFLGIESPIVAMLNEKQVFKIGTKEEYLYQRLQIQSSLKRLQIAVRYTNGGHGRTKKCQAIERFNENELNYVTTKMHQYSAKLIQIAVAHRCSEIVLVDQKRKEEEAKQEPFVLRNWSYHQLNEFITYKANKYGISITNKTTEN